MYSSKIIRLCIITVVLVILSHSSIATHLRAAEIRVFRNDCSSLTVEIIITAYINYQSGVFFGGENDFLSFGDGTSQLIPEIAHEVIDPFLHVGRVQYKAIHTYSAFGQYKISYSETNRNSGILNFDQSVNTLFYTETSILLEPGVCNSSPSLLISPVDRACTGVAFFHNPGAVDLDNDSLSYELLAPQQKLNTPVSNYLPPNNQKFYSGAGISFAQGNEQKNGPPTFTIDPTDGTIKWDAPGSPGEYAVAIKVKEWKFNPVDSVWYEVGYVIRDMQIIVEKCSNQKPELIIPLDFCVTAGTIIQFDVPASDPDNDNIVIEVFSDAFNFPGNKAIIDPANGTLQSTNPPNDTASVQFVWETTCEHVKSQPYKVIFKISDRPASGPRLVRFYIVNIKVIAPAPKYENITINPITKKVTLQWKDYACEKAETFQVWRRISELTYEQPDCNMGMPHFLRYQLMAELPATTFTYTDSDLSFGAQYCYRIVALVGNREVPSRISLDTCFIPKPAEAPVLLNVSVNSTDETSGDITIRWTSPFDIDQQQYPPPYQYKIYRAPETDPLEFDAITGSISDTTFTDTGLNTTDLFYQYKIELYVPSLTSAPVDTSSTASSVFLTTKPLRNGIDLTWETITPWYNYSQRFPYHLIYRSDSGPVGLFILIDSVNVNENDLHYIDSGQFNNRSLIKDHYYYYKILTRGTYGNSKINTPLENFSQVAGNEILDTTPPCTPVLTIAQTDCSVFSCDPNSYFNVLEWGTAMGECADDIVAYELSVSQNTNGEFTFLGIYQGNSYTHANLNSLAKCYKIVSIDDAGNRSDSSERVCNENCLSFKLPNVLTPGIKDNHNDFFTTYTSETGNSSNCTRFVKHVDLKIYDRWGDVIFTNSINPEENLVFWAGLNNAGTEMSSGVYFYSANVFFYTLEPENNRQQIKGWVHLLR